jgi:1-acyl-sn-glycerol-3-phosphate acyltransferase
MLAAGVPIIPTCISGAYFHQPRWGGKAGEPKITVRVGKPISVPKISGKDQTEKDIDSLYKTVLAKISALGEKV